MKRFIILNHIFKISASALIVAALPSYAVKAKPGLINYTQPDGSTIEIRLEGNGFYHRALSADGKPMMLTEQGEYLPIPPGIQLLGNRGNETGDANAMRGPGLCSKQFPSEGSPRVAVFLVEYSDREFGMENPADFYNRLFNEEGFTDYGATGSVADWFRDNSNGKFSPQFDIYGPVKLANRMYTYGKNDYIGNEPNAYKIVTESAEILDEKIDFSTYDNDGDGVADLIYAIYCGYGEADSGRSSAIWPHSYELTKADREREYVFDGILLDSYACSNEVAATYERPDGIGTIVHEFSHALGLPDLYPTAFSPSEIQPFTPGDWSILDSGSYNNEGRTPPNYSTFERYALGWLTPTKLRAGEITLDNLSDTNEAFILSCGGKDTEYYLFETRLQEGNDRYLPDEGMLVWHVDFDSDRWERNIVNNEPSRPGVDLLQADGTRYQEWRAGASFPGIGGITVLGEATSPALRDWSGNGLGYELSDITQTSTGVSFHVSGEGASCNPAGNDGWQLTADGLTIKSSEPIDVYSSSGVMIGKGPEVTVSHPDLYIVVGIGGNTRKLIVR